MTGYKFKITNNASGDYFYINDFTTNTLNFIALQDYPNMDVDIRNSEVAKEGQHGVWDFFSFYGKRVINFSGVIIGESEVDVEDLKRQLLRVISLPPIPSSTNDGTVLIQWTDANGDDWQINAKLQGYPRFSRDMKQGYKLLFNIVLKAKYPEIESQAINSLTATRGWIQGALLLPTLLPAIFDTAYNQSITILNSGAIPAHTKIYLYGESAQAITNPTIKDITTNKFFKVNTTLADETKYIVIDSKYGTVIDQDGIDKSAYVDSTSEYILLTPGSNELIYTSDETPITSLILPTAQVTIQYRDTII